MTLFDLEVRVLGKVTSKWGIKIHQDPGKIPLRVPIAWVCFSVEAGVEFVEIEDISSDHVGHVSFVHQCWALPPMMILDPLAVF